MRKMQRMIIKVTEILDATKRLQDLINMYDNDPQKKCHKYSKHTSGGKPICPDNQRLKPDAGDLKYFKSTPKV